MSNHMNPVIVSDSSCDLFALDGVSFASAPLKIITDEREFTDVAGMNVTEMVTYLRSYKGKSTTSCPNVQDWLNTFAGASEIFGFTITSRLSGSYATAMQARQEYKELNPSAKVHIFDSLSAGPELPLLIERTAQLIREKMPFDQIVESITEYSNTTHLLFCLKNMKNLARNGRVHPSVAAVANVLGIRLVGQASEVGELQPLHRARGEYKAIQLLFEEMKLHQYAGGKVRITHCLNPKMAYALRKKILQEFRHADIKIGPSAGLCSFYAEEGGIMVGYEG